MKKRRQLAPSLSCLSRDQRIILELITLSPLPLKTETLWFIFKRKPMIGERRIEGLDTQDSLWEALEELGDLELILYLDIDDPEPRRDLLDSEAGSTLPDVEDLFGAWAVTEEFGPQLREVFVGSENREDLMGCLAPYLERAGYRQPNGAMQSGIVHFKAAILERDWSKVLQLREQLGQEYGESFRIQDPLFDVAWEDPDKLFDCGMPPALSLKLAEFVALNAMAQSRVLPEFLFRLEKELESRVGKLLVTSSTLCEIALYRGQWRRVVELTQGRADPSSSAFRARAYLMGGDVGKSLEEFDPIHRDQAPVSWGDRAVGMSDLWFLVALVASRDVGRLREARARIQAVLGSGTFDRDPFMVPSMFPLLLIITEMLGEDWRQHPIPIGAGMPPANDSLSILLTGIAGLWNFPRADSSMPSVIESWIKPIRQGQYHGRAFELACLKSRLHAGGGYASLPKWASQIREAESLVSLVELLGPPEVWERVLRELSELVSSPRQESGHQERLVWVIREFGDSVREQALRLRDGLATSAEYKLLPVVQKRRKNGGWTSGRHINLESLERDQSRMPFLTSQDRRLVQSIGNSRIPGWYYRAARDRQIDPNSGYPALVGHPHVFFDPREGLRREVEVASGQPRVDVQRNADSVTIRLVPKIESPDADCLLVQETPHRFVVIKVTHDVKEIARILRYDQLTVPGSAEEKVRAVIAPLAQFVMIESQIDPDVEDVQVIESDSTLRLLMSPQGEGLKVMARVRPLGDDGPLAVPGQGGTFLAGRPDGQSIKTVRDHQEERDRLEVVLGACPCLTAASGSDGSRLTLSTGLPGGSREARSGGPQGAGGADEVPVTEWFLEHQVAALEFLLEAGDLGDRVLLEWPEGESLRIARRVGLKDVRLRMERQGDWFSVDGDVPVDEGQVLRMRDLIRLTRETPGRFVRLPDGSFLALTRAFQDRLRQIEILTEESGKSEEASLALAGSRACVIETLFSGMGSLEIDSDGMKILDRMRKAQDMEIRRPRKLRADLRVYQKEGFEWMARMSHWGAGVCLADDMGLGKTVQAIAILLRRARAGPSLVVVPTSVQAGWKSELSRFGPSLVVKELHEGSRDQTIRKLKANQVLLVSYGLLVREIEDLASVTFGTVILDEAQAIKNPDSKRARAATRLTAGFRLALSGTPVENHLEEVWSLFRFLNPGLLGSRARFRQHFLGHVALPGSANPGHEALATLVRPFILRRTKAAVLKELPSRTEVLQRVPLSSEERSLYEAVRREAIEECERVRETNPAAARFQVLAMITRLRQACCHPKLVLKESDLPSTKLVAFGEIVEDLIANDHRCLVFSQFVSHLALVRSWLESAGIEYEYLDGSMSQKARSASIESFQVGARPLFLISLKAGGVGLNLTAADYVIHLDPWWNPAVEDQASDRAHRIGQVRPVTIYRLIAQDTVEDRIVTLHHQKRALADTLLAGTDSTGMLGIEDLMSLMDGG